jgi:hypothetical protein
MDEYKDLSHLAGDCKNLLLVRQDRRRWLSPLAQGLKIGFSTMLAIYGRMV